MTLYHSSISSLTYSTILLYNMIFTSQEYIFYNIIITIKNCITLIYHNTDVQDFRKPVTLFKDHRVQYCFTLLLLPFSTLHYTLHHSCNLIWFYTRPFIQISLLYNIIIHLTLPLPFNSVTTTHQTLSLQITELHSKSSSYHISLYHHNKPHLPTWVPEPRIPHVWDYEHHHPTHHADHPHHHHHHCPGHVGPCHHSIPHSCHSCASSTCSQLLCTVSVSHPHLSHTDKIGYLPTAGR